MRYGSGMQTYRVIGLDDTQTQPWAVIVVNEDGSGWLLSRHERENEAQAAADHYMSMMLDTRVIH
jgi:hypothetical protein